MIKDHQPTIFNPKQINAAVSCKKDGNLKFFESNQPQVVKNRQKWFAKIGIQPSDAIVINVRDPKSWDQICDATAKDRGLGVLKPNTAVITDAIITNQKGLALCLLTADCNPVIILDPIKNVLALVHLGWQSTAADLATKIVQHFKQVYGSNPADLLIYNGPSIRAQSYMFEPPITQMDIDGWQPYLVGVDGRICIDLVGYNRAQFIDAGVLLKNIQICQVDTAKSPDYFSHYRAVRQGNDDTEGRFMTSCMLI